MTFHYRPAKRERTPLIVGLAGPTKSGKTMSALRLGTGMANGGQMAMLNAEGLKGHQYADRFQYVVTDIGPPYRPERYREAVAAALAIKPAVLIVDSVSHMHDGPGGMLEYHEDELQRLAGDDERRRNRNNFSAWVRPKHAENAFIYDLLAADCHIILCFRAKEKLQIVPGKDPVNLGWQPITSDRMSFETLFTLVLPPHSKGVPDLAQSDMREPFDVLVPGDQPLSENTGRVLAEWAKGSGAGGVGAGPHPAPSREQPAPDEAGASSPPPPVGDGSVPTHLPREPGDDALALRGQRDELIRLWGVLPVTVEQMYSAVALLRGEDADDLDAALGGRSYDLLLDALTAGEAHNLISRLATMESNTTLTATGERGY